MPLFVGMLTQRPWEEVTKKGQVRGLGRGAGWEWGSWLAPWLLAAGC